MAASDVTILISLSDWDVQKSTFLVTLRSGGLGGRTFATAHLNRQALQTAEEKGGQAYGVALGDTLLAGNVRDEYQKLVGEAHSKGAVIHVQLEILSHAPELHALPWERLYHHYAGNESTPLAITANTPFSRFLSGRGAQAAISERPLRLLLAIADPERLPEGFEHLSQVDKEVNALAELLVEQKGKVVGSILPGHNGLSADLRTRLKQEGWTIHAGETSWQNILNHLNDPHAHPHVLHILAHGTFETPYLGAVGLELSGELDKGADVPAELGTQIEMTDPALSAQAKVRVEQKGQGWSITDGSRRYYIRREDSELAVTQSIARLLLEEEDTDSYEGVSDEDIVGKLAGVEEDRMPQLVFLAACDSAKRPEDAISAFVGLGPRLVEAGVPAVVAMQDKVDMRIARDLTSSFYRELFQHGQVDRALNTARAKWFKVEEFGWAIPVLFLRLTDGRLFAEPELPSHSSERARRTNGPAGHAGAVLFDECHGQERWFTVSPTMASGFKKIAAIATERGVEVKRLLKINKKTLQDGKMLVLAMGPRKWTYLTDDEIEAITDFVHRGGGLLVLGAYTGDWHHEANLNTLLQWYGMAFHIDVVMPSGATEDHVYSVSRQRKPDSPFAVEAFPVPDTHDSGSPDGQGALLTGVSSVMMLASCSLSNNKESAIAVLQSPSDSVTWRPVPEGKGILIQGYTINENEHGPATLLAASTTSKVIVAGCWTMFLDAFIDDSSHSNNRLFRNILDWLIG